MIYKKADIITEQPSNVRGGVGSPKMTNFMNHQTSQGVGRLFAMIEFDPGVSIGYHQHVGDQEAYYIISGVGTVEDNDGVKHDLEPGDCMLCFDGESHSIINNGTEPLRFIAIVTYTGMVKG